MNGTDEVISLLDNLSAGAIIASSVFALALAVLGIVAMWKIFVKAGEAGWKAIIPFYNTYILFKICWETKQFWTYLILTIVISILSGAVELLPSDNAFTFIFAIASLVASGFLVYYSVMLDIKLSQAFGHGGGFAVGLIFLTLIFECILAFGDSKYVGNQTPAQTTDGSEQNK